MQCFVEILETSSPPRAVARSLQRLEEGSARLGESGSFQVDFPSEFAGQVNPDAAASQQKRPPGSAGWQAPVLHAAEVTGETGLWKWKEEQARLELQKGSR